MQELIRDDESREVSFGPDRLSAALRGELRTLVERLIREELFEALGAEPYQRTPERRGYQHSPRERTITTGLGPVTLTVPRGRLFTPAGGTAEWSSELLPRYARRTREVSTLGRKHAVCMSKRRCRRGPRELARGCRCLLERCPDRTEEQRPLEAELAAEDCAPCGQPVVDGASPLARRERLKIITERIDALLAESRQMKIDFDELIDLIRERDEVMNAIVP